MYPSVIVLNTKDKFDLTKIVEKLSVYPKHQLLVASKTRHNIDGIQEFVCDDNDDKIINSLMKKVEGDKLVIVRDMNDYDVMNNLLDSMNKNNQIALLKRKKSKITMFFLKIINLFINFLYGYKLYNGEINAIGFSQNAIEILKLLPNCSFYTKINKWTAFEFVYVDCEKTPKIKFKVFNFSNLLFPILEFVVGITFLMLLIFVPVFMNILILKIVSLLLVCLCFSLFVINTFILCIKTKIGEVEFKQANFKENI